jgi:hypothetical protein
MIGDVNARCGGKDDFIKKCSHYVRTLLIAKAKGKQQFQKMCMYKENQ